MLAIFQDREHGRQVSGSVAEPYLYFDSRKLSRIMNYSTLKKFRVFNFRRDAVLTKLITAKISRSTSMPSNNFQASLKCLPYFTAGSINPIVTHAFCDHSVILLLFPTPPTCIQCIQTDQILASVPYEEWPGNFLELKKMPEIWQLQS